MFASLKSKIKEETGNDIAKLTSSWRSGSFLGRMSLRDDSTTTTTTSSSGGQEDSTSESISPQMESYLSDRTGGQIDQSGLQDQYLSQLEFKLKEWDAVWERKMDELKLKLSSLQGEEAAAAQTVARAAQAEAARATSELDTAVRQLQELKTRLAESERAQDRLDTVTEELEQSRREWARSRSQLAAALSAAEGRAADLADELEVMRAALPQDCAHHRMHDDEARALQPSGSAEVDRLRRERAVLARQLQEAKMALADVKTSWSGQIAALETQVARLSRQAGEEGAERRRVESEKREMQERLVDVTAELEKARQSLVNSEAKVVRLNGEVHTLAMEVKSLRSSAEHVGEKTMDIQHKLDSVLDQNRELQSSLDNERTLIKILQEKLEKSTRLYDEARTEVNHLNSVVSELQHDCLDMERKVDKERRDKDDALLRNASVSQALEMSQSTVRYLEGEAADLTSHVARLETLVAQHKENQAACMLIKENEETSKLEVEQLHRRIVQLEESEDTLKKTIQELETEICDRNKKIKSLDNRISDMKKTLQRELQTSKSDLTSAEEQDISRRYLKHVILRFLTARELEARQLTRALSVLLRLSAREEAALRATLAPRTGLAAWFPSINNT